METENLGIMLNILFLGLSISSTICVLIHLYKFFRTTTPQSLLTKYLTFYCFILLLIYIFSFIAIIMDVKHLSTIVAHSYYWKLLIIIVHLMLTATCIKSVVAFHLFWCFRKVNIYPGTPFSLTHNKKLIIYCLLGASVPLPYTIISYAKTSLKIEYVCSYFGPFTIMRIICIARLFLIFGAFWYIKSSGVNRKELCAKYSLHIRILIMLGGFSSVSSILEIILEMILKDDKLPDFENFKVVTYLFVFNYLGYLLEGAVITILLILSFRKERFQSPTINTSGRQTTVAYYSSQNLEQSLR